MHVFPRDDAFDRPREESLVAALVAALWADGRLAADFVRLFAYRYPFAEVIDRPLSDAIDATEKFIAEQHVSYVPPAGPVRGFSMLPDLSVAGIAKDGTPLFQLLVEAKLEPDSTATPRFDQINGYAQPIAYGLGWNEFTGSSEAPVRRVGSLTRNCGIDGSLPWQQSNALDHTQVEVARSAVRWLDVEILLDHHTAALRQEGNTAYLYLEALSLRLAVVARPNRRSGTPAPQDRLGRMLAAWGDESAKDARRADLERGRGHKLQPGQSNLARRIRAAALKGKATAA